MKISYAREIRRDRQVFIMMRIHETAQDKFEEKGFIDNIPTKQ